MTGVPNPRIISIVLFLLGSHVVEYAATDSSGNSVTCRFTILVKDTEAPTVSDCLSQQRVVSTTNPGVVTWKLPTFTDNVDVISTRVNMKPLTQLRWGNYTIKYLAKDEANNTATCDIQLLIVGEYSGLHLFLFLTRVISNFS